MPVKVFKPTSPGRRDMSGFSFEEITRTRPERSLVRGLRKRGGRNVRGKITVRHRGGGHKRLLREIDQVCRAMQRLFRPHKLNVAALGNLVPQLHVHLIARQTDDPAWPAPVWGRVQARPYETEALVERVRRLRAALGD